jgi:beta-phosphoglucomutase family hydrolase
MKKRKAFLFDLNGTMIDDMQYHITAWHRILNHFGANLSLQKVKEECYGRNNELLERIFPGRFNLEEQTAMILDKEIQYQKEFLPHLKLIKGLEKFLKDAHDMNIPMAVGSAAIMFNIDFVLDNLSIRKYFDVVVSADDVTKSKPDPETFLKCAALLGIEPKDCIVFEDAPKGVESAQRAGMQSVVITSMHPKEEFPDHTGVLQFIEDYDEPLLSQLVDATGQ